MTEDHIGDTPLTRFLATQTLVQLRELRSEYRTEIEQLRIRTAALEDQVPLIELAIHEKTGSRKRPSKPPPVASRNGTGSAEAGSLRAAILQVMQDRPHDWTRQDLYEELRRRGQAPRGQNPKNTLGNRLLEMAKRGEIKKAGRGTFAPKGMGRNRLFIGSAAQEAEGKGS
jgi:hypothetical protein